MSSFAFREATKELLFLVHSHPEDQARVIEAFLEKFGVQCGRAFMTSLTQQSMVTLFTDQELLERMSKEQS